MKASRSRVALFGRHDSSTTGAVAFADPSRLHRRTEVLAAALTVAALLVGATLALTASSASALIVNPRLGEIAGAGSNAVALRSESVAVNDHNGHIYVADSHEGVVRDYASATDPSPETWNGGSSVHGGGAPAGSFGETGVAVAVDNATGDVYVSDAEHAVIDKFDQDGNLIAGFGDTEPTPDGQLAGLKTPAGSFSPAGSTAFGIAVDQETHDLYAIDAGHGEIDAFSPEGEYLPAKSITEKPGELYGGGGAFTDGIAVDANTGDLLVSDSWDLKVYAFDLATGTLDLGFGDHVVPVGEPNEGEPEPNGILTGRETPAGNFGAGYTSVTSVDSSGEIYVADTSNEVVDRFNADGTYSGHQIAGRPGGSNGGLAIDQATADLYVANNATGAVEIFGPPVVVPDVTTKPATDVTTTSATLNGEVDPAELEVEECAFEYGETETYGAIAPCEEPDAEELGEGNAPVAVHADVSGLNPGATYHFRLIAANANATNRESGDRPFSTGASIVSTSASGVSATAATLDTELNPNGVTTTYHFEYDTVPYTEGQAPHGISTPIASAGSGTEAVIRSAQIQGLQALTVYHFRVVAQNALGTVVGPDRSFTTQGAAASLLPDSRAWELVSPPDKHGTPLESIPREGGIIQAAADGSAITYVAHGPTDAEPPGNRGGSGTVQQLLSRRGTGGWATQDIATPHQAPVGVAPGLPAEYKLFSNDLSLGAVEPFGATRLSPQATERTPYLRQADGSFTPLVTPANVPPGTKFGGTEEHPEAFNPGVTIVSATLDLAHVLLNSSAPLVGGVEAGFGGPYEWSSDGAIKFLGWGPSPGAGPVCGGAGTPCIQIGGLPGGNFVRHAISDDGSRVVFKGGNHLFLRDLPREETLQLDFPAPGGEPSSRTTFQDASADGSRVFFTSNGRLTVDSTSEPALGSRGKPDLYMCRVSIEEGHLACALRDLTANTIDPSEPADVLGAVIGTADDGSSVYLVANGALAPGAVPGDCGGNLASESCNLYRVDTETGATKLIAVLSGADFPDWGFLGEDLGTLTARVSPDGRYLAFMSRRPLTGYDNRDAGTGASDEEVFLYDSAADSGAGNLVCASCDPTGARPRGVLDSPNFPGPLVDRAPGNWAGQTLAANVPGWTRFFQLEGVYQSRYLSNSGRLFFNAADALVPQDTNGVMDVYEYEPPTVGSCTASSPTFGPASGGCVSLISSGTSPEESAFMDASESGDDVFFLTASKLAPTDVDNSLDLYDASVGGSAQVPAKPVECVGDGCQQPAVPPSDATPNSLSFNGAGNAKECPKGKKLRKGRCVQQKSKKHKNKHHKKKGKNSRSNGSKKQKRGNAKGGGHK